MKLTNKKKKNYKQKKISTKSNNNFNIGKQNLIKQKILNNAIFAQKKNQIKYNLNVNIYAFNVKKPIQLVQSNV